MKCGNIRKTIKHTTINENVKRDKHEIIFFQGKKHEIKMGENNTPVHFFFFFFFVTTILLCTKQKKVKC